MRKGDKLEFNNGSIRVEIGDQWFFAYKVTMSTDGMFATIVNEHHKKETVEIPIGGKQ